MSVTSLLYQTSTICALFAIRVAGAKTCYGTSHGGNLTGVSLLQNYQNLISMYTNCTHVYTNLEITYMQEDSTVPNYNLSFLQNIRYVGGYVLISGIESGVDKIPLNSLQVIRGNSSYFDPVTNKSAALAVINNTGLTRLHLNRLTDISEGDVLFRLNENLKYVNGISWLTIQKDRDSNVHYYRHYRDPGIGSLASGSQYSLNCTEGRGWDDNPLLCQAGLELACDWRCNGTCFGRRREQCCDRACAVSCSGGGAYQCTVCKDYKNDTGDCIGFCPAGTFNWFPLCSRFYLPNYRG